MRTRYTPKLIFSVHRHDRSDTTNWHSHASTVLAFKHTGITFMEVEGQYSGVRERAIILKDTEYHREIVSRLTKYHEQDCILSIDEDGIGTLEYVDGSTQGIGQYRVLTERPQGDYTLIGQDYVVFNQ